MPTPPVNGLAIGVLGPLGGWVLSAGSLEGFPGRLRRALLPFHLPLVPIMIILYYRLVDSRVTFRRIAVLAPSFLLPCLVFVLTYSGIVG